MASVCLEVHALYAAALFDHFLYLLFHPSYTVLVTNHKDVLVSVFSCTAIHVPSVTSSKPVYGPSTPHRNDLTINSFCLGVSKSTDISSNCVISKPCAALRRTASVISDCAPKAKYCEHVSQSSKIPQVHWHRTSTNPTLSEHPGARYVRHDSHSTWRGDFILL